MRKNWAFRNGLMLFLAQAIVFPIGSPIALGVVSILCLGFLLGGLFFFAVSECGVIELVIRAVITVFLIFVTGRALFLVVESLTHDLSGDIYVGYIVGVALALSLAALIYGIFYQIRRRRVSKLITKTKAG